MGWDRTGQDRTGQDRTGQDRRKHKAMLLQITILSNTTSLNRKKQM